MARQRHRANHAESPHDRLPALCARHQSVSLRQYAAKSVALPHDGSDTGRGGYGVVDGELGCGGVVCDHGQNTRLGTSHD